MSNERSEAVKLLDELAIARKNQRVADAEVQRLKVELGKLTVRLSLSEETVRDADFGGLVRGAMDAW